MVEMVVSGLSARTSRFGFMFGRVMMVVVTVKYIFQCSSSSCEIFKSISVCRLKITQCIISSVITGYLETVATRH